MVSPADVNRARSAIAGRIHRTPTLASSSIGAAVGARVALKAELLQRTGSFKPRGVLAKLASLDANARSRGVIAASSGNHAQALAYCAAREGIDVVAVMPRSASRQKLAAARGYGATVVEVDGAELDDCLRDLVRTTQRTLVHAFDDPIVIAGQGTIGLEILEEVPEVDVIVAPASGAGLVAGIAVAVKARKPAVRVVAAEAEASPSLTAALRAGRPVPVAPATIADALAAPIVGAHCLPICSALVDDVVLVTDAEILTAMRTLYLRAKLACEPAGAAATAAILSGKAGLREGDSVVAIVSGGNVDLDLIARILGDADPP